jgi:hypothetical protein
VVDPRRWHILEDFRLRCAPPTYCSSDVRQAGSPTAEWWGGDLGAAVGGCERSGVTRSAGVGSNQASSSYKRKPYAKGSA